jgi:hypothetical protein
MQPDECLSLRGAEAVAVGPADLALPPYAASRRDSLDHLRAAGVWVKCETGVMRNPPPPPPRSLDGEPVPARDLYAFEKILDPAGFIAIRVARGGEGGAATAPGERIPTSGWPATASWPVLHRPVHDVLAEMRHVANEHFEMNGFRIGGERWTANRRWLADFARVYAAEVNLPIRTTLYAPDITPETAALLAAMRCEEVRVPIGSGSALIRNDILGLNVTDAAAEAAFAALRRAGVPAVASVEIGAPYETPESLEQTVQFLRRLDPDRVDAALHYPVPGSHADKAARENGWLVSEPAAAHLAGRPAVALPRLTSDDLVTACEALPYAVVRPYFAHLIRLARRVRIGKRGTMLELVLKPFLAPPKRRRKS